MIECIDVKEHPLAWKPNGDMAVGIVAATLDEAVVILHQRHPDMQPVKAYKFGKVFYFPKDSEHGQS